mgnify:CR=1 FL=1
MGNEAPRISWLINSNMKITKFRLFLIFALVSMVLATQSASAQTCAISGKFVKVGEGGEALSALQCSVVSNTTGQQVAGGYANADGTFSFQLPYGSYFIFFSHTAQLSTPAVPLVNLTSSTFPMGDIPVYVANRTISGRLLDEFGDPATGYLVSIGASVDGNFYSRSEYSSLTDGSYAVAAFDANWTVAVVDYSAGYTELASQQVTVAGANLAGIDFTITTSSADYTSWLQSHALSGSTAKPTFDADGDSFNNQAEFLFGSNPKVPDAALFQTTRSDQSLTVSWLERTNGLSYFVRGSTNFSSWSAAAEATVVDDQSLPVAPDGYAKKKFEVSAVGKKFFRLLATDNPTAVPDETFSIKVAGEPITVERWGTGPKAVVFFGYLPFTMANDLKNQSAADFRILAGTEYSMFLWTYPGNVAPFSQAMVALYSYGYSSTPQDRLALSGIASSVVSQVRSATGLQDICLVGNSFGAGVVLWDLASLSADTKVRFVLISPTEAFIPPSAPEQIPLPRTILVSDAERDSWFYHQADIDYVKSRTNGSLPPGYVAGSTANAHFIIGQSAPLPYVFDLISRAFALQ